MYKKIGILAIISLIIIGFAITPITFQNDTFYTIKIGEHIINNGIDMQDPFSWHEDLPYTYPHWAYDVGTYLIYNISGFSSLYIATGILSIILALVLYYTSCKLSKSKLVSLLVSVITMLLLSGYIAARAQLVTFILFVLTILFIEQFLETKKKIYGIMLILIPILIANVHLAVWPFYFILFLPYLAEYIISLIYFKVADNKFNLDKTKIILSKNSNIKWLFLIVLIASFTGFFTPLGTTPYTYLVKTLQGTTTASISEHLPLVLINKKELIVVIGVFLGIFSFTKVKIKLCDLLMICGLAVLAIASNRQVSMLVLIGSIVFTKMLYDVFNMYKIVNWEDKIEEIVNNKLIFTLVIIFVILIGVLLGVLKRNDKFINEASYPIEASQWIKENLDVENMRLFNEYNYGSYLLYQDIPVFIDSRADLYAPEFNRQKDEYGNYIGRDIFDDFIKVSGITIDYDIIFEKYDITHIILMQTSKLNILINKDDKYNRIYSDDYFVIYEVKK